MNEDAKKTSLYIKIGEFVFFLLTLSVKIALVAIAIPLAYLICFFVWADYVDTYGNPTVIKLLNESARVVVRDYLGAEKFQIEQVWVQTAVFDGGAGNWKILLDEPFQYSQSSLKDSDILRPSDVIVVKEEGTQIGGFVATDQPGYTCYFRRDVTLGAGTVCEANTRLVCHVSVCVKEGERLLYVQVVEWRK